MLSKDDADKKMQDLCAKLMEVISVMDDLSQEAGIERVPFLGGIIHFGTKFPAYSDNGVFERAVGGPIINDRWWSASSFDCWPEDGSREWMWGDDRANWRKTSYEGE
jgi:hypothetical protein